VRDKSLRLTCKHCGRGREEVGLLSATGQCSDCQEWRREENSLQLKAKRGPFYDRWRAACRAAFED